ncbi:hypothetical protein AaE_014455 [Aphanomyces astaci]|uniref:DUF6818 domain-containing protein n=1 Tax=Aphanomyces astaci TaxID=112090 RepID=A0A6A4Z6H4_APHAT|nr:hypothetical protein AaE_014455 [Aphanomyces astaci]
MNARKPRTKSKNFSSEETSRLLDLVEELKPFGGNMWERVAFEYNRTAPSAWPERDGVSLKRRFQGLNNKTKPTGTSYCPPDVERAKRIYLAIESKVGAIELHDQEEYGDAASDPSEGGQDDMDEVDDVCVEDLVVTPRLGKDTADFVTAIKVEKNKPTLSMAAQRRSSLDNSIAKLVAATDVAQAADPFLSIWIKMEGDARARDFEWKKEQAELRRQEFLEREESKKEQAEQRRRDDETRRQELKDREEREREARKREQQHELVMMSFMAKLLGNSN